MAFEVKWTSQAIDDLSFISDFISKDSPYFAQVQIEKLFQRTIILGTHPKAGRIVPEAIQENLRELTEGSYRIIYHIYSAIEFISLLFTIAAVYWVIIFK